MTTQTRGTIKSTILIVFSSNVHCSYSSKKLSRDQEDLLDAKTIFKYKAISKLRRDIPIVTELVSPQNLGFLIGTPKDYGIMKKYGQINVNIQSLLPNPPL